MSKLIDADKACKAIENSRIVKDTFGSLLNEWDHGYNYGLERAEDEIQDFIVEAIPISWIEKHIENAGFVAVLNSHSVEFMLRQWYREQAEDKKNEVN